MYQSRCLHFEKLGEGSLDLSAPQGIIWMMPGEVEHSSCDAPGSEHRHSIGMVESQSAHELACVLRQSPCGNASGPGRFQEYSKMCG